MSVSTLWGRTASLKKSPPPSSASVATGFCSAHAATSAAPSSANRPHDTDGSGKDDLATSGCVHAARTLPAAVPMGPFWGDP